MDDKFADFMATKLDDFPRPGGMGLVLVDPPARKPGPLVVEFDRALTAEDVLGLETEILGSVTPQISKLRDTHHTIARLLAQGLKGVEVAAITGFSSSRISILKQDPAFKELLAYYSEAADGAFHDAQQRLGMLALDATAELHDRLLETPEKLTTDELLAIAKMAHDRSGTGPTSNVNTRNTTINMTPADVAAIRQELAGRQRGTVENISAVRAQIAQNNRTNLHVIDGKSADENDSSIPQQ